MKTRIKIASLLVVLAAGLIALCPAPIAHAGGSMQTVDQAAATAVEIELAPGDTSPHRLAALIDTYRGCKRIKLIAPNLSGSGTNAGVVKYGTDNTKMYDWIATDGSRDDYLHLDNPFNAWYQLTSSTDKLWLRIEF